MNPEALPAETPISWPVLSTAERRVLGVLVEKAKTTPDVYPLSINALVAGCNQKSNRDPVLNMSDVDAEDALTEAQGRGLVVKVTGGRVVRWRHMLYEAWNVNKVELAVLAELLLRGAQTEGELRGRASRMEPIEDLDTLRAVLKRLAERGLVVYLTPEGRRGTSVADGFLPPAELERLKAMGGAEKVESAPAAGSTGTRGNVDGKLAEMQADIDELRSQVSQLQATVTALVEKLEGSPRSET